MTNSMNIQKKLTIFGLPLLMLVAVVFLINSSLFSANTNSLSIAITVDLLLTIPFVYFLLIRKTSIPKTTVVPFIILGVIVGSFTLPTENQYYLSLFKTWVLPLIELAILSFVIYNIIRARKRYKSKAIDASSDFFTTLKATCYDILPKAAVIPFVTEIAVFYYGFIYWKKRKLKTNEFSYHKNSGTISLLIAVIFLIAIETVTFHILLAKWSHIAAWILTGMSVYSGIQIFGFLKSMSKRPIMVTGDKIYLRYGIMNQSTIDVDNIASIELSTKEIELDKTTRKFSFLGDLEAHNTIIILKTKNTLTGLYGIKRDYKVLALHVDENTEFKNHIEHLMKTETAN